MARVTIIGDGGWGTAFGLVAAQREHTVCIWGAFPEYIDEVRRTRHNRKFLKDIPIPPGILYETDIHRAVAGADIVVNAVPSKWVRPVFTTLRDQGFRGGSVLSLTKGIESETLLRPTEVITELVAPDRIGVLSGPSHAEEIARGLPATVVAAAPDMAFAGFIQASFASERLRIYTEEDLVGVEIAGALKNVIALAAGICEGLALGDNAKAALLTRGVVEMARLGKALGANPATFYGLSGIGDLITTCYSGFGRNRNVGVRLGRGERLADILGTMEMVAEGVFTARAVVPLARKRDVSMPIAMQVHNILFAGLDPRSAVRSLMSRDFRQEKEKWAETV
ncbi:MAG: NAD(P)H-dependent glycerol-3-phosphate dehydrogenase [Planctomycetota bacterium]